MKLKTISLLLLIAVFMTLAACAPQNPPAETTETREQNTAESGSVIETLPEASPEEQESVISLFENGKWNFRIVTKAQRSPTEVAFSTALVQAMSALTGAAPHTANDIAIKGDDVCEIIIGYTQHPIMKALYSEVSYGEASIRVIGNKILVAAYTEEGYNSLLAHLKSVMTSGYTAEKLSAKVKDFEKTVELNAAINMIPTASAVEFSSIANCGLNQTLIIHKNASTQAFEEYVKKYGDYECVSEVYESGNCFATFDIGSDTVNVSYSSGDNCLRIIHAKNTEPASLLTKGEDTKAVCEPMLILHGLGWSQSGYSSYNNGLCLIIRIADGRFLVVDGGFDRKKDADDLYKLLSDNTPEGMQPTVAAWFITHAHSDHHATFATSFASSYRTKVKVETVIFNPPAGDIYVGDSKSNLMNGQLVVANVARSLYGAELIRPHVGDRYYIGDTVIDMLYTVDYQYPEQFEYYNMSSIIFSLKIAGQRMIITGDGANTSFDKMVNMYGSSLKADIVQVAHHGYGTGVSANASTGVMQGYTYMSPSLVLWPISESGFASVENAVYNVTIKTLPSVKKIIVAEGSDHVVMLPFKAS